MNPAALVLVLLLATVGAILAFILLTKKPNPSPSRSPGRSSVPSGGASTVVTDDQWKLAGVYPQWDDGDVGKHLEAMMTTNAGFGNRGQWSTQHFGFLFYPGVSYTKTVQVGYLTTVHGMGLSPTDVSVPVMCLGDNTRALGALDGFWRGAENLQLLAPTTCPPTFDGTQGQGTCQQVPGGILPGPDVPNGCPWGSLVSPTWAASQASALRRVSSAHLMLDFQPSDVKIAGAKPCPAAFASGGFAADCAIDTLDAASFSGQQQYMFVGVAFGSLPSPNVWNYVFAGCTGAPLEACGTKPPVKAVLPELPITRNKPVLAWSPKKELQKQAYSIYFDEAASTAVSGVRPMGRPHGFAIATSEAELQALLQKKTQVIVLGSPNDIEISQDLVLETDGTTIVGMGMPVLLLTGTTTVRVKASGCSLCGLIFDCRGKKEDMLSWESTEPPSSTSRGLLADCYFRVGGTVDPTTISCNAMCHVKSGSLIIENAWMWRADHGPPQWPKTGRYDSATQTYYNESKMGLWVEETAQVTAYGLACEHSTTTNCKWEGDNGQLYFFQCELPYCVAEGWNFPGLFVTGKNFTGTGLGVYCYFPDSTFCQTAYPRVDLGVSVPADATVKNVITVWLNGVPEQGGIEQVISCGGAPQGSSVTGPNEQAIVCSCSQDG